MKFLFLLFGLLISLSSGSSTRQVHQHRSKKLKIHLHIDTSKVIHKTNPLSPSVAAGLGIIEQHWVDYFRDPKFVALAKGLGPLYFRVGGTKADVTHFQPNARKRAETRGCQPIKRTRQFARHRLWAEREVERFKLVKFSQGIHKALHPIAMTESDWIKLNELCSCVGWKLIFGLNLLLRDGGSWNSTNAQELIRFTENNRFKVNWELGNEPNAYHHKMNITLGPEQIGQGFQQLKRLLASSPWWNDTIVVGPDINRIFADDTMDYIARFLDTAKSTVDAMTVHQYDLNGRKATIADFENPKTLNALIKQLKRVLRTLAKHAPEKKLWLGETASAYGGGAIGLSDSYLDGFTWLDKLGVSSRMGVDMVIRQSFLQSHYSLIDSNFDPLPDYWLTLLYKRLVGHQVLNISLINLASNTSMKNKLVRMYAHCANIKRSFYKLGSVVMYFINLKPNYVKITFNPVSNRTLRGDLYLLEPGIPGNLTSGFSRLNGIPLHLTPIPSIPPLQPNRLHPKALTKGVHIPPYTYGFLVLYNAKAKACLEN